MIRPHLDSGDTADPPVSKTMQYKKITKPLLERKRRARINACLDELKVSQYFLVCDKYRNLVYLQDIMTGCLQTEGENVSKLEKADILELTVRHIQKLSASPSGLGLGGLGLSQPRNPVEDIARFRQGYSHCATEAAQFLLGLPGVDVRVGQRLVSHLMGQPQPQQPPNFQSLIQQRMLSSLLGFPGGPPQPPPSELLPLPSASIKTEQVIPPSPAWSQTLSTQSELFKPVPVKPAPLRPLSSSSSSSSRPDSTSPQLESSVWKPYS